MALAAGLVLALPGYVIGHEPHGGTSTLGTVLEQLGQELGFLLVAWAVASNRGASPRQVARRLGLRTFRPSALKWMGAAIGAYLLFSIAYLALVGEPHQENVAEDLGPVVVQVVLIAILAPIAEETCFRGMLFGGLRVGMPRLAAALVTGLIFGGLHATEGISVVPPLVAFGFILALLYEETGSIVPGILLHMLNNSVALIAK
jgi:membrane protease YdiL (CAAX protease family)